MSQNPAPAALQSIPVIRAEAFCAIEGVNVGDAISFAEELQVEDIYSLTKGAPTARLGLSAVAQASHFYIGQDSELGMPNAEVHVDSCLTFMAPDGSTREILLFVELYEQGVEAIYLHPLGSLDVHTRYTLVGIDTDTPSAKLADVSAVAFAAGTHITLASGEQRKIENLKPGDRVLTRDAGAQEIRWIGKQTARAVGPLSPIRIKAGTLNNLGDLILSPNHRLFVYQRTDRVGAGRPEILVKAQNLVNGTTVIEEPGGFIDYVQILFDEHHIIYAEGIAAETMVIDALNSRHLPQDVQNALATRLNSRDASDHGYEISDGEVKLVDAAEVLRRASLS
ncbi:Hint domain-containing protein [Algirhabdus cladophorae]|uniref:Hint domain-containing protein n=1 Tax=Algirhabdus cladophorae TaxID=3377108 RepID=UPI003B8457DC